MKIELTNSYCSLKREPGDARLYHESAAGFRMKTALNAQGYHFVRLNPSRHGLTGCTLGLIDRKAGIILWHERYAIENAATEFNHGEVTFQRVAAEG